MRNPESGFRPANEKDKKTKKRPSRIEILSAAIIASISVATVRDVLQSLSRDEKTVTTEESLPSADPRRSKTHPANRESFASDTTRRENPENVTERLLDDIDSTLRDIIPKILPPEKQHAGTPWMESYTRDGDFSTMVMVSRLGIDNPAHAEDRYVYSGNVHDGEYFYDFGLVPDEDGLRMTHLVIRDFEEAESIHDVGRTEILQKFDPKTIENAQPEIKNRVLGLVGEATHEWQEAIANDEYHPENPMDRASM